MSATQVPRIAVIVPCYNIEGHVGRCLDALAAQTHDDFEVFLIDDGSTDDTGQILDERAASDSRFRVIHQENRGLSASRNAGVAASSSPLVAFADGDDYMSPAYLEVLDTLLTQHDADMACCGHVMAHPERAMAALPDVGLGLVDRACSQAVLMDTPEALRAIASTRIHFAFWSKLMTRKLAEANPFPVGMVYEDIWTLGHIVANAERIVFADVPIYCYVSRGESITRARTQPMRTFWQFRDACAKFEEDFALGCGLVRAMDDGAYCQHLVHRLCGQYVTLNRSLCEDAERREIEGILFDELHAAYRLALFRGVPAAHPQMIRARLLLHSPKAHDAAYRLYRKLTGS